MMDDQTSQKAQFDAEIRLAGRGVHVLMERIALKRMPTDAFPIGDVYEFLNAAGEQLEIQALQNDEKKVTKRRLKKATRNLVSAIDCLTEWPVEPRLQVVTELVATLRTLELDSIADNLLVALQQADLPSTDVVEETPAEESSSPLDRVRNILENDEWTPELENLLRELRELSADAPEDEDLIDTLKRGILFNAVAGRDRLLLDERRRLAKAEPLPDELAEALDDLAQQVVDSELVRLGLHLVLADVVAAGLVPENTPPKMTVAATMVAMLRLDEPGRKPNIEPLGTWAKTMSLKIDVLSDDIAPVFEWMPPDQEGSTGHRHEQRWKVNSLMYQLLPARWMPDQDQEPPPYSKEKAGERVGKLGDIAWLMIDEIEAVRFVSEAFRYGGDAPDAMDLDLVHEIIDLWEEQAVVRSSEEFGRAYLEDEWNHEIPKDAIQEDTVILPAATTSDGEPLVLSTVVFDVLEGVREEIIEHLDSADGFRREAGAVGDRWEWLGPRAGSDKVIADVALDADNLTVMTHSLARASRANAALADLLGERIVLKDIRTEQPTSDALAELGIEIVGDKGSESADKEQIRVVHEVLEKHYRKWLEEPLPALGDITPREGVTDPVQRAEVIKHLLEAEERTRASTSPMNEFDFDFLWTELGLDRNETN